MTAGEGEREMWWGWRGNVYVCVGGGCRQQVASSSGGSESSLGDLGIIDVYNNHH